MKALRKLTVLGLGLLDLTEERARELADELIKRGEAREDKASQVAKDLLARGEEARKNLQRHVEKGVERVLAKAHLAAAKDLEAIERRVAELEKKLAKD